MAQTIKLKRSATQNAVPSTSSLALGELAINTYDGKLFIKKNVSGTESIVTIGEVGANSIGPTELASTAVTAGSYGSTSAIPVITIDADGRITSASTATISGLSANSVTSTEIAANAVGISELNVSDGTDGQVLTTDGNGNLAFEDQSGGAASATAFSTNIASGDGSTTAFTLSESPSAESKIIAFINGVFQNQDAYTISGTTLTFDTAPISGTNNVVVYVIGDVYSGESVLISNFSGDASTTAFTLANNPGNENNTQVYIDGVYQQKTTYSVSGTTLTFSSAPPTGTDNIEVVMLTSTTVNTPAAGSVVTASMADDSVTASKIVSSAVTTAKIADSNVTTAKVADSNVTTAKIADSNVTTAKIADDAVTIGKIADAALVIESEGIGSNDNDTTLPTSAAVKDYVDTQVAGKDALSELSGDTDDVTEGSTNLYFTNARADARITNALKDEDNMASNSATHIPSQQSVKAYVDSQVASKDALSELSGDTDDVTEGSTNLYYTNARVGTYISGNRTYGNITTTGYIAGPSTFTIDPAAVGDNTGTVVIAGNLQVDGTTTTINSTTVNIDDLNIQLATGAINAAAADGAGITVDGASATITYDGTNDEWDFNKGINITGTITSSGNITGTLATAAQPNITSLGTITGLTSSGTISINSSTGYGNLELGGASGGFIDFKTPFSDDKDARIIYQGTNFQILTNADQPILIKHNNSTVLETSSSGIEITGSISATGDITLTEGDKIKTSESSGGSHLLLRDDNLGVTSNSMSLIGLNDILIGAKSNNSGTGNIYFGVGAENKSSGSGWTDTLTILEGGNVGIGTTSPSYKLHTRVTSGNIRNIIVAENTGSGSLEAGITVKNSAGEGRFVVGSSDHVFIENATEGKDLRFLTFPSGGTTGTEAMRILHTGRVGIGEDLPNANLHIGASAATGNATNPALQIGGASTYRLGMFTTAEGGVIDNANGDDGLQFHTKNAGEAVRITADGNLQMIGQTSSFASPGFTYHTNNYLYCRGGSAGLILSDDSGINTVQIIDGASGYINFETGDGSSRMRINSSRIEIDPTNDRYKFTYDGSSFNEGLRMAPHSNDYSVLILGAGTGDSGSVDGQWTIARHPDADNNKFTLRHQSDSIALTVLKSGNVGIGVDAPSQKLEVDGRIKLGGMILQNTADGGSIGFNRNPADGAYIGNASLRRFQLNGPNTVGGDFWEFQSYNSSGTSVGNIRIQDGNLGIGTTPSEHLHVNSGTSTTVAQFQSALGGAGNTAVVKITASGNSSSGLRFIQCGSTSLVEGGANAATVENTENAPLLFGTNGTERMRIDSSGNVGIAEQLTVGNISSYDTEGNLICYGDGRNSLIIQTPDNNSDRGISFRNSGGAYIANLYVANTGSNLGDMVFGVSNGTQTDVTNVPERMRISKEGSVGIGGTPNDDYDGYLLQLIGSSQTFMSFGNSTTGYGALNGLVIGNDANGADIYQRENQPLRFHTNNTERMRILNDTENGTVCINASDTGSLVTKLWAEWDTATNNRGPVIFSNPNTGTSHRVVTVNTGGNSKLIVFDKGFASKGSISTNGSSVAYNTTSDYRLKENVDYTWDATTRLKQLKPARFNFIDDETNTLMDGFIAHEVSNIVPEAVVGERDAVDEDDNPIYQEMDAGKLIPLLVKTIQEMEARITELEG